MNAALTRSPGRSYRMQTHISYPRSEGYDSLSPLSIRQSSSKIISWKNKNYITSLSSLLMFFSII